VELKGVDYSSFKVPPCRQCEEERREKLGIVKPNVVFFVSSSPLLYLFFLFVGIFISISPTSTDHNIEEELTNREKPYNPKIGINRTSPSTTPHKLIKDLT